MDRPSKEMLARMPLAEAVLVVVAVGHERRTHAKLVEPSSRTVLPENHFLCVDRASHGRCLVEVQRQRTAGLREGNRKRRTGDPRRVRFQKTGRLPVALSQAFLSHCTAALRQAFPEWAEWKLPKSLRRFRVIIFDGKALKRVAKRLKPLRGIPGGLLGGRALVALEWCTGLAVAMRAHEDGDANDVKFVGDLVPIVCEQVEGPRLWMGDSAFCDLTQPQHYTANEGDHFLVRYHPKTPFYQDRKRKQRKGKDERGRSFVEKWGYLGSPNNKRRRYVRMICVERAGEKPLILVTDLLDADAYPAEDLLWLYAERWGIEQVFQKVTEVFGLKRLIGGSPKACIFQFAFCLLLYNMIQVIRGYLAETHDVEPEEISTEKLFDDVEQQLIAWNVMFEPDVTLAYFASPPKLADTSSRVCMPCWAARGVTCG